MPQSRCWFREVVALPASAAWLGEQAAATTTPILYGGHGPRHADLVRRQWALSRAAADALERISGCPVGVCCGDALGEADGRRAEAWGGDQRLQSGLDLLGGRVGWELDPSLERFDPTCVERLIAPEREKELWHP